MPAPKGHPPYKGCETGGRPKIYTLEFIDREAIALEEWIVDKQNIFVEDFCYERGYHESRIDEFVRDSEKFSLAYKMLKMRQKSSLFKGGLNRKYAHNMCALILSTNHNIHLKTEQKLTGSATDPLEFLINQTDGKTKDLVNEQ